LTTFGNQVNGDEAWSWSMTVHGSAEFYDVAGERLADKVHSARLVICVSDFTRSQLMAQVTEQHWDKLRVIRCGVNPDEFAPHRVDATGDFALVTVARLTQGKGHGVLLEALRELRDRGLAVRLILVGDGPKRSELEALARKLGIESAITFVGAVGREDVHEYYRAADAFCLPSFHEGVPVVLMEAMALELPVIATDVMGIRELVEHERNGLLVRPGRSDILAAALQQLIVDADLRRRLGAAGRETVLQTFDIRRSAAEIHAAFEELLGVPSARPQASMARERTPSS
jgi:glycosyltransferase involved in cell wall biosynthesis